jgi:hypothetical protein
MLLFAAANGDNSLLHCILAGAARGIFHVRDHTAFVKGMDTSHFFITRCNGLS